MQRKDTLQHHMRVLSRVDEYLAGDLSTAFGIGEVAAYAHASYHHLAEIFQNLRGESLGSYITRRRLERAAILSSYTKLNLSEIADKTGFATKHSLSKAFSQTFGMPPGRRRNNTLYRKDSPNILLDGITSEAQYESLLAMEFAFTCRRTRIEEGFLAGQIWRLGNNWNITPQSYEQSLRSLRFSFGKPAHRFCLQAYDSVNFTALRDFKAFYGVFVEESDPAAFQQLNPECMIIPVKKGDYLVFDVPKGKQDEVKQYITLFRENLVWHKKIFTLHDFYDFFVFSDDHEAKTGEYFIYCGT